MQMQGISIGFPIQLEIPIFNTLVPQHLLSDNNFTSTQQAQISCRMKNNLKPYKQRKRCVAELVTTL